MKNPKCRTCNRFDRCPFRGLELSVARAERDLRQAQIDLETACLSMARQDLWATLATVKGAAHAHP